MPEPDVNHSRDPFERAEQLGDRLLERFARQLADGMGETLFTRLLAERGTPSGRPDALSIDTDVIAWRWRAHGERRRLEALRGTHDISVEDLLGIDRQVARVDGNTRQFVLGHPRNNVLLWGARGTGKSSLVKAMLNRYHPQGLRLVEIDAHDLIDLPEVVAPLSGRPERFILFVDDLSFDAGDASYRTLKAALDGSIAVAPENVVIYATSNRRHLLPEQSVDNEHSKIIDGELHHGEAVEEKISLSERFGLWLAFHPFSQAQYLAAVDLWLQRQGLSAMADMPTETATQCHREALQWALLRGNRSGRIAWQFAMDYAGRQALAGDSSV